MLRLSPGELQAAAEAKRKEQRLQRLLQTRQAEKLRAQKVRQCVSVLKSNHEQELRDESMKIATDIYNKALSDADTQLKKCMSAIGTAHNDAGVVFQMTNEQAAEKYWAWQRNEGDKQERFQQAVEINKQYSSDNNFARSALQAQSIAAARQVYAEKELKQAQKMEKDKEANASPPAVDNEPKFERRRVVSADLQQGPFWKTRMHAVVERHLPSDGFVVTVNGTNSNGEKSPTFSAPLSKKSSSNGSSDEESENDDNHSMRGTVKKAQSHRSKTSSSSSENNNNNNTTSEVKHLLTAMEAAVLEEEQTRQRREAEAQKQRLAEERASERGKAASRTLKQQMIAARVEREIQAQIAADVAQRRAAAAQVAENAVQDQKEKMNAVTEKKKEILFEQAFLETRGWRSTVNSAQDFNDNEGGERFDFSTTAIVNNNNNSATLGSMTLAVPTRPSVPLPRSALALSCPAPIFAAPEADRKQLDVDASSKPLPRQSNTTIVSVPSVPVVPLGEPSITTKPIEKRASNKMRQDKEEEKMKNRRVQFDDSSRTDNENVLSGWNVQAAASDEGHDTFNQSAQLSPSPLISYESIQGMLATARQALDIPTAAPLYPGLHHILQRQQQEDQRYQSNVARFSDVLPSASATAKSSSSGVAWTIPLENEASEQDLSRPHEEDQDRTRVQVEDYLRDDIKQQQQQPFSSSQERENRRGGVETGLSASSLVQREDGEEDTSTKKFSMLTEAASQQPAQEQTRNLNTLSSPTSTQRSYSPSSSPLPSRITEEEEQEEEEDDDEQQQQQQQPMRERDEQQSLIASGLSSSSIVAGEKAEEEGEEEGSSAMYHEENQTDAAAQTLPAPQVLPPPLPIATTTTTTSQAQNNDDSFDLDASHEDEHDDLFDSLLRSRQFVQGEIHANQEEEQGADSDTALGKQAEKWKMRLERTKEWEQLVSSWNPTAAAAALSAEGPSGLSSSSSNESNELAASSHSDKNNNNSSIEKSQVVGPSATFQEINDNSNNNDSLPDLAMPSSKPKFLERPLSSATEVAAWLGLSGPRQQQYSHSKKKEEVETGRAPNTAVSSSGGNLETTKQVVFYSAPHSQPFDSSHYDPKNDSFASLPPNTSSSSSSSIGSRSSNNNRSGERHLSSSTSPPLQRNGGLKGNNENDDDLTDISSDDGADERFERELAAAISGVELEPPSHQILGASDDPLEDFLSTELGASEGAQHLTDYLAKLQKQIEVARRIQKEILTASSPSPPRRVSSDDRREKVVSSSTTSLPKLEEEASILNSLQMLRMSTESQLGDLHLVAAAARNNTSASSLKTQELEEAKKWLLAQDPPVEEEEGGGGEYGLHPSSIPTTIVEENSQQLHSSPQVATNSGIMYSSSSLGSTTSSISSLTHSDSEGDDRFNMESLRSSLAAARALSAAVVDPQQFSQDGTNENFVAAESTTRTPLKKEGGGGEDVDGTFVLSPGSTPSPQSVPSLRSLPIPKGLDVNSFMSRLVRNSNSSGSSNNSSVSGHRSSPESVKSKQSPPSSSSSSEKRRQRTVVSRSPSAGSGVPFKP